MSCLVTGASGFLGRKLVNALLAEGKSVHYLGRRQAPGLDTRAAYHPWNLSESPSLDALPPLEAIFHLIGEPIAQRWNKEVKQRIRDSRIASTRTLVSAFASTRRPLPKVLVSASAVGYYGDCGDQILTEANLPGAGFLADLCSEWESEASRAAEFGLRVVLLRIGVVLGKEGGALKQMLPPFRLGLGGPFGNGHQWMPWIHVDDLIRLFLFSASSPSVQGPVNGTAPEPVTNAQFTRELAHAIHRPAILPIPKVALRLALGELAGFLFASLRVLPQSATNQGFQFRYATLGPALHQLLA